MGNPLKNCFYKFGKECSKKNLLYIIPFSEPDDDSFWSLEELLALTAILSEWILCTDGHSDSILPILNAS